MSTHALSSGDLTADRRADYARMLGEGGDPGAAAELMEQALDLVPGWAAGWFRLGEYRQKAGLAGAADAYRRALECDAQDIFGAGRCWAKPKFRASRRAVMSSACSTIMPIVLKRRWSNGSIMSCRKPWPR